LCQAKVAGRGVAVTGQFVGGYALCFGRAPLGSGGRRLVGLLTVVVRGGSVAKPFSFVIEA
jgi:hypothetical protein